MKIGQLTFNISFYEMSLGQVIKQASDELFNLSRTSFMRDCIKMTQSLDSFHHVTFKRAQTCRWTFNSQEFLKIFVMVILH